MVDAGLMTAYRAIQKVMRMVPHATTPYMFSRAEGPSFQAGGAAGWIKAAAGRTGGAFNLFEVACPPHYATPLHLHYAEDVAVYILEGALTFFWGEEAREAGAGAYFYQPRGTPHGFRVKGAAPVRLLYLTIPAGLDRLALEQGWLFPTPEAMVEAAHYQIEILGPLPE